MASVGPSLPGSGSNNTGVGSTSWTTPENVTADDTSRASSIGTAGAQSNYLWCTNFGFNVPSGATIDGVVAEVQRYSSQNGALRYTYDAVVSLIVSGSVTGDNKGALTTKWPTSEAAASYGADNDGWGASLTQSIVNASNFGIAISVKNYGSSGATAYVDCIKLTIYYTTASGQNGSITAVASDANADAAAPSLSVSVSVDILPSDTSADAVSPSVFAGTVIDVSVSAAVSDSQSDVSSPGVSAVRTASIAVPVSDASSDIPAPSSSGVRNIVIAATVVDASADMQAPVVSVGQLANVNATTPDAVSDMQAPAVTGVRNISVTAIVMDAQADLRSPVAGASAGANVQAMSMDSHGDVKAPSLSAVRHVTVQVTVMDAFSGMSTASITVITGSGLRVSCIVC